ncbi:MAG: sigma-70 family RNA polymerase sigma factor, partial [Actinomycetota bacterium]|nr:sigma-70 family RNA polymerase sigma factor [Actinomycetota bacterium]
MREVARVPTVGLPTARRDREGYAAVFAAHRVPVLRFAYLLVGNQHVAEEVTAEAFARVWPHWRAGRVEDERTYLRKAVVNEVRSRWRRRALERREEERRRRDPEAGGEESRGAEHDRIVRALATLPEEQRAVVVLRFLEDLSLNETAAVLGLRTGTVKSKSARALERLRA